MPVRFTHLRLHTEYSLVDGLVCVKPLMKAVVARGMNAVAVTDFCNLFAAVKLFQAAIYAGVKPIIGADILCFDADGAEPLSSLVLLCQNKTGYRNLTCLISKAYQEGQHQGQPRVHKEWLPHFTEGLIALSGGRQGAIGQALLRGDTVAASALAAHFAELFPGRFYLEIQRTGRANENLYNKAVVDLANSLNLPLVATNDVRFLDETDFDAHEARVCIHRGETLSCTRRSLDYSSSQYLRSADEMAILFADLPMALENSVLIGERCTVHLELGHNYLPNFPTPDNMDPGLYLSELAKKGLNRRLSRLYHEVSDTVRAPYDARLETELTVINNMGFPGYFLIVADFIQWAKSNGVPVGPGRGSGAGSLVAYALDITDLDPLQYELLFERFLNPERVSMPDFDIDFCMDGRDRVIEYVAEKYGRQSVSQIITFGTMAAKAVVRDVGRALGHPYGFVDKLAKLIPFELGITLTTALQQEENLARRYAEEPDVRELFDLALKLEGIVRNAGKHAGGVVIAPSQLTDFTAIYCEEGSTQIVSQYDKDDVEAVGLVKFDFLGLRTLTIIDRAVHIINNAMPDSPVDITLIPTDDKKTFDLLKTCQTTAIFQLESRGMKEIINRLQPHCFEEIIALVALFRPGPLQSGMVDDFIDRKQGRAKVIYPHPALEPILSPTYGVILYQEQVMQIAQTLAGFTLGAADLLRRAMGKKKAEEMAQQRAIFTEGAQARGVAIETATYIFDLMEKFAGYGFNKSHSAAYALVAYQTAWLKAHYPAAFMAAVMSCEKDNTDKLVISLKECASMKLTVRPPDVNASFQLFTMADRETICYGLSAIKGIGDAAIDCVIAARDQGGLFTGLFNLCSRIDLRKVNRRVLEALIKSGALDCFQVDRNTLLTSLDVAVKRAEKTQKNQIMGQADLFSSFDEEAGLETCVLQEPWTNEQRLQAEKETLGFYLSGHPTTDYTREFGEYITPFNQLNPSINKMAYVCGLIISLRKILTKRGKQLLIMGLEDGSGTLDVVIFPEAFAAILQTLQTGHFIIISGEIAPDSFNGGVKMTGNQLFTIAEARTHFARALCVEILSKDVGLLPEVEAILLAHPGKCPVQIRYKNSTAAVTLNIAKKWWVLPSNEFLAAIGSLLGRDRVSMVFSAA